MGRSWSGRRSGRDGEDLSASSIQLLARWAPVPSPPCTQPDMSQKPSGINPQFLAIGIAIGVAIGMAMHNVGVGIGIGVAIGIALGAARGRR